MTDSLESPARPLEPKDCAGYLALMRQIDEQHFLALPGRLRKPDEVQRTEAAYLSMLERPDTLLIGVDRGGEIVGVLKAVLQNRDGGPVHLPIDVALIDEFVVHDAWHRRGIGRILMSHATAWARSRKARSLELKVYEFNEGAIAFYEQFGMRTLNRTLHRDL